MFHSLSPRVRAALVPLPLAVVTAAVVHHVSNEGRFAAYVVGVLTVVGISAWLATGFEGTSARTRGALGALWVVTMPLFAGASTEFALALFHPKREGLEALFGGAAIGFMGGVVLYPGLLVMAVFTWIATHLAVREKRG